MIYINCCFYIVMGTPIRIFIAIVTRVYRGQLAFFMGIAYNKI
ncbi:hypothetical protein HMPREF3182_00018 [Megasphaera hutchinsoni]|uniref:Uncharacterized protein n=1 Tax=Megasphaera hutchinsoni TaxID=1588748 RepID=A0A134CLL3_9FIRM|nr:hypothetical protein HMPREF3182_00018 [Megasphaera hutchinsoni]